MKNVMQKGTICIEDIEMGMTRYIRKIITDRDIEQFAEISTDHNPVHLDDEYARDTIFEGRIAHGMLTAGLISAVICVIIDQEVWVPAGLWVGHLLVPTGAFGQYEHTTVLMMVLVLAVSTTSWLIGVITLRRAWRIIGALDLVLAWIIAGLLLLGGATEVMVLIMLTATEILLGLVIWLGKKYESEISNT